MIDDHIERAWNVYQNIVERFAEKQFEIYIRPWLRKNNYEFVAGNGSFWIGRGNMNFDVDKAPKQIRDILQMEIPGMPSNDLGSLMPEHRVYE